MLMKNSILPSNTDLLLFNAEFIQHTLDSLIVVVLILDNKGTILYVNKPCFEVFGKQPDMLIGTSCIDLVESKDGKRTWDYFQNLVRGQQQLHFVNKCKKADGGTVPISWASRWDAQSQLMYCTIRDITVRQKEEEIRSEYEKALLEKHQEMMDMLGRITDGFLVLDEDGRIVSANFQAGQILDKPVESIISRTVTECFPSIKGTIIEVQYGKSVSQQIPVNFEVHCSTPRNMWMEINAYPSTKGMSVFFRDITIRKQTEAELRKLSLIAKETTNAVVISDQDRKVVWINRACEELSGYHFDEAVGRSLSQIFDGPLTDPELISYTEKCFKALQSFHIEVLNYKKSGVTYWADVSCQPLFNDEGKLQYYFSIATDITQRKNLEAELQQQQKKTTAAVIAAQEKERALVGQELHDNVNQVLTTVKLYAELCRDGIGNTEEIMDKSIKLLQDSINEVRSLSKRLSAPSLGDIKLKESIKELIEAVAATNKLKVDMDLVAIEGLEVGQDLHLALYRILQEHFTNVLKHSEAGFVKVWFNVVKDNLFLEVNDDGNGFDPKQKRSGIGIANMTSRADNIGGELFIESAPGRGCTLKAQFPLKHKASV
jgi:PAS domain S-box-containing protein